MGPNVQRLVEADVLDEDSAARLEDEAAENIEALSDAEIDTIIKVRLNVSKHPWEPNPDGSIF